MPKGKYKKYPMGGYLNGPSHTMGGIPIEAEGGEYIVSADSVNEETLPILEQINETGFPISNAMERVENYQLGGRVQPPTASSIQPQAPAYKKGGKVK